MDPISLAGLGCPVDIYDQFFLPKFSAIQRGSRLTPKHIFLLRINPSLRSDECKVLLEMLFKREKALAWTIIEKGRIIDKVEPSHVV
jgi:hypothetical protein